MTAAPTTASALLAELTSVSDGISGSGLGFDVSGLADQESPLSALSVAGFDNVRRLVSFLDQPLQQLVGDPGLVSSTAQDLQAADEKLSSLADSYRTSLTNQTSTWSGTAADSYRGTGTQYADGIAALGQATSALSSAVSEGGAAVAQTAQGVRQDIHTAVDQMLPILKQAQAQAAATHGASMAEAIPQCVRIATACGLTARSPTSATTPRDAIRTLETLGLRPARAKRTRRGYAEALKVAVFLCRTVTAWPSQTVTLPTWPALR